MNIDNVTNSDVDELQNSKSRNSNSQKSKVTLEMISLRAFGRQLNKLNNLTPHAEAVREWLNELDEEEYINALRAMFMLNQKCKFIRGWGPGSTLELYSTWLVNKELKLFSPQKVNRKRNWRTNKTKILTDS